jgi:hypothetical protein
MMKEMTAGKLGIEAIISGIPWHYLAIHCLNLAILWLNLAIHWLNLAIFWL